MNKKTPLNIKHKSLFQNRKKTGQLYQYTLVKRVNRIERQISLKAPPELVLFSVESYLNTYINVWNINMYSVLSYCGNMDLYCGPLTVSRSPLSLDNEVRSRLKRLRFQ